MMAREQGAHPHHLPVEDDPTPDGDARAVASLVWAIQQAAGMPGVLVWVDPDLSAYDASAVATRGCHGVPLVTLSPQLATARRSWALYSALGHEIAHHYHGHQSSLAYALWSGAAKTATGAGLALAGNAMWSGWPWWPAVAAFAISALCKVARQRGLRLAEYDADLTGARILDKAGVPGVIASAAGLGQATEPDRKPWQRYTWWLHSSHPPITRRIAALHAGRPARRLFPRLSARVVSQITKREIARETPQPLRPARLCLEDRDV